MSTISTHVLDTHLGQPAANMPIQLSQQNTDGGYQEIASGITNDDGRIPDFLPGGKIDLGIYRMRFDTGTYHRSLNAKGFYPEAIITFEIAATDEHYHVPLLISPFGLSTYRGS